MVHVRLKVGYKQDFSLEVDELDEELIFDVPYSADAVLTV
jgi:hypothetical protein